MEQIWIDGFWTVHIIHTVLITLRAHVRSNRSDGWEAALSALDHTSCFSSTNPWLSCSSHADVLKSPKCQAHHLKHFLLGQLLP